MIRTITDKLINILPIIFGINIVFKLKSLFLYKNLIHSVMRKFAIILVIIFVTALVFSSCNQELCPAYSKADVEHAAHQG
jgi:hypothetical protein